MKNRREFIEFMGRLSITAGIGGSFSFLPSCAGSRLKTTSPTKIFKPLAPSFEDRLLLADGFKHTILIKEQDPLGEGIQFGSCNDYTAFIPLEGAADEGLLWVNHEYSIPLFTSGYSKKSRKAKTLAQTKIEQQAVGGSILHLKKKNSGWELVTNSVYNRRLDATTRIPFAHNKKVLGSQVAKGTLANCAGGVTPWGTILSCEENYHQFYGEAHYTQGHRQITPSNHSLSWTSTLPAPPEHYGWVVEVDLKTGAAQKHTALGRFAHEGATCVLTNDGRAVVYLGDDNEDECFYKFVASKPKSLEEGTLYVANLEQGKWIPLTLNHPQLKGQFKDEMDLKIRTRQAAALVGGTRLDRPEDCEIDPLNGAIYLCCTNNDKAGRPFGALLKFMEKNNDFASEEFSVSEFLPGGASFACPDNLAFDQKGNIWMTSDMASEKIGANHLKKFGNNALYYIPLYGDDAGKVLQVASAPKGAEFTGPCFSPDGKTLFLSVQHPGEGTQDIKNPMSRWPLYKDHLPLSSVIQIQGPALEALTGSSF